MPFMGWRFGPIEGNAFRLYLLAEGVSREARQVGVLANSLKYS
jgi:hypothetical protein